MCCAWGLWRDMMWRINELVVLCMGVVEGYDVVNQCVGY